MSLLSALRLLQHCWGGTKNATLDILKSKSMPLVANITYATRSSSALDSTMKSAQLSIAPPMPCVFSGTGALTLIKRIHPILPRYDDHARRVSFPVHLHPHLATFHER